MENEKTLFYNAEDIQMFLGISRSKAYCLIRNMNSELQQKGYIVIPGKVPKKYFSERYYGGINATDERVAM